ncbi:NUDIX hydrolase [Caenispirillum bisanense]|uniref:Uncharacterized conserved protein n=1 Tax=Caenispirillum bisanense TaxID=414052 RepID=A0A286G8S1_9PROT|nr:hypothetical protein [Caenispirillum bisanense]SOD91943.1 Uncharacterized conserved protein [Caenispirillum bisanense]
MTPARATPAAADSDSAPPPQAAVIGLTAVVAAVTDEAPRVLVARRMAHGLATEAQRGGPGIPHDSPETLPYGPFEPERHRTLELGLRQWVEDQTGLSLRYVEQLYTFGNQYRDPRELYGGPRLVSVAYLALTHETAVAGSGEAEWRDWYSFLPWEDWREGRPAVVDHVIVPHLRAWADAAPDERQRRDRADRVDICFGLHATAGQDRSRTLDRYELLYEAQLVPEAMRDAAAAARTAGREAPPVDPMRLTVAAQLGTPLSVDNRRILASALGRLRGKIAWRPVVFDLLPPEFTLLQLQRVVEALAGARLHKQNFRRTLQQSEMVEATGRTDDTGRGRPAELYRFRRDVLRERHSVGIGLPLVRTGD